MIRSTSLLPAVLLAACVHVSPDTSLHAADNPKQAAVSAAEADADFALQGEYAGEFDKDGDKIKIGVQVIALGNGKFRAMGYPGGLPGDGYKGEGKVAVEGQRDGDEVVFQSDKTEGVRGVLQADGLHLQVGVVDVAVFKKVHRKSSTLEAKPPKGAVVLFGGKEDVGNWNGGRVTADGLLQQGVLCKTPHGSGKLHLEFQLSYMPFARGQGRSNSGCYLQGRYEVQMLDSFGLEGENNECGGIYTVAKPSVNMCYPPLAWQTYDIDFTAPTFNADGKKTVNARMTVHHNGVLIHNDVEVPGPTRAAPIKETGPEGPLHLQNHGNPVRYRNIWFLPSGSDS